MMRFAENELQVPDREPEVDAGKLDAYVNTCEVVYDRDQVLPALIRQKAGVNTPPTHTHTPRCWHRACRRGIKGQPHCPDRAGTSSQIPSRKG